MILVDANILIYAFRAELPQHRRAKSWLEGVRAGESVFLHPLVSTAFLRLTTKPLGPLPPAPVRESVAFLDALQSTPGPALVESPHHLGAVLRLAEGLGLAGDQSADLWLAAFALTNGLAIASANRGFARFPGLRWINPVEVASASDGVGP